MISRDIESRPVETANPKNAVFLMTTATSRNCADTRWRGAALSLNTPARARQSRKANNKPGSNCICVAVCQEKFANNTPTNSGVIVSLSVAPVPLIDSAVARCSGKRFDNDAAAVGCHIAVPKPISAEPSKAQINSRHRQKKIGRAHGDQRQREDPAAIAHHGVGDHAEGQLAEANHDLLGRSQRADFDVGQMQSRLDRRQNHRIELLEPMNDEMAGGEHPEEPDAFLTQCADRCQKMSCGIHAATSALCALPQATVLPGRAKVQLICLSQETRCLYS